jgi:hypothetical protein
MTISELRNAQFLAQMQDWRNQQQQSRIADSFVPGRPAWAGAGGPPWGSPSPGMDWIPGNGGVPPANPALALGATPRGLAIAPGQTGSMAGVPGMANFGGPTMPVGPGPRPVTPAAPTVPAAATNRRPL